MDEMKIDTDGFVKFLRGIPDETIKRMDPLNKKTIHDFLSEQAARFANKEPEEDGQDRFRCKCGWEGCELRQTGSVTHADTWWVCPKCGKDAAEYVELLGIPG